MVNERKLPDKIKLLNITYTVEYVDKPSDVDIFKRNSCWGQIDFWTRSIRIYKGKLSVDDLWETLWHEILHGICEALHMKEFNDNKPENDQKIDLISLGIYDVLRQNNWFE